MTVRQVAEQTFPTDGASASKCVRDVLYGNRIYKRVYERPDGAHFSAIVQPNIPLVLGTDVTVALEEVGAQTRVIATVESQPAIMGDAFGFYERYVRDFFSALQRAMQTEGASATSEIVFGRSVSWVSVVSVVVPLLLLLFGAVGVFHLFNWLGWLLILMFLVIIVPTLARMVRDMRR